MGTEALSIAKQAARGGFWLAGLRLPSQAISWIVTIIIARILVPEDYGLVAMATVLTAYLEIFITRGLGAAIIQKKEPSQRELSSIFWFSVMLGTIFAFLGQGLAHLTAWLFHEPRVAVITQLLSGLFLINALMVVPHSLLSRAVRFKETGLIELSAVAVSSLCMLWMATKGFGVYTLVLGTIILRSVATLLLFWRARWRPEKHFDFSEVRPFVKFGLNVAGSQSMSYLSEAWVSYLAGTMLGPKALGYYAFMLQCAKAPNDKVMSVVNQVALPVFSRYQDDRAGTRGIYLRILRYVSLLVVPILLAGFFFGNEVVAAVLGEKWLEAVYLFRLLCLGQCMVAITQLNNVLHTAQGRPHWDLCFQTTNMVLMGGAMFVAAGYGVDALGIPWVTLFPAICVGWTWITVRKVRILFQDYLFSVIPPFGVAAIMLGSAAGVRHVVAVLARWNVMGLLVQEIAVGIVLYGTYLALFERKRLQELWVATSG